MLTVEKRNQAFLGWINECNYFDPANFLPFFLDDTVLGYVHKNNLSYFTDFDNIFVVIEWDARQALTFQEHINDYDRRTRAANEVASSWLDSGVIGSWVGEQYNVNTGFNHPAYFTIERAASSLLGIRKYGVHLNAWVEQGNDKFLWVAKRAKDKPTFPGKLDHLVAGGHGVGYRIEETMIKECAEEANIPESIAQTAQAVSMVSYVMERNQKLQQDNLFVYDLQLEADFVPENTDGEAEAFYLWPVEKVLDTVAQTRDYKTNCNLVIIDFAIRHGYLKPDEPFYSDICAGLHHCL